VFPVHHRVHLVRRAITQVPAQVVVLHVLLEPIHQAVLRFVYLALPGIIRLLVHPQPVLLVQKGSIHLLWVQQVA